MQVKKRLRINSVVWTVSVLVILAVLLLTIHRLDRALEAAKISDAIITSSFERLIFRTDYHRTGSERSKKQLMAKHEQIGGLLKAAADMFPDPEDKQTVHELLVIHESIGKISKTIRENREKREPLASPDALSPEIEDRLLSQLNMRVYETILLDNKLQESGRAAVISSLKRAGGGILFVLLLVSTATLINSWIMSRSIADRVQRLRGGAVLIGEGNLEHRIEIEGDDEFVDLSGAFNAMTAKLRGSYHDLEKEVEERTLAEEALQKAHDELELRVDERTKELKDAERSLREINETLEKRVSERTDDLQEANASLLNSRRAALNLMEDAFTARKEAEQTNQRLLRLTEELENLVLSRTRLYSVLAKINGAIVRIHNKQALYEEVCRIIVEEGSFSLAWIGILDVEGREVRPVASFGKSAYLDGIRVIAGDVPEGKGPTGRAVSEEHYVINADFEQDTNLLPWQEKAREHGLRSSSAFPLHTGGQVIGAFTIYSDKPDFFTGEEVALLNALAENVSFALDSIETEKYRSDAEEKLRMLNEELGLRVEKRTVELQAANAELESFIYSVSHDLRAPLRSMSSFSQFLMEDYSERLDDQAKDYLSRISRNSAKMSKLIEDLLNLSTLSRQELDRSEVDMSELAAFIVAGLREADPGRSVEVSIENGLTAFTDPSLTEVVLSNLLGNAWKFSSKTAKARIEFRALVKDGKTVYYVRDNGAGFDPHYSAMMFQPFHRLHSGEEFEGTGIGLAIVERVVRRHDGKVWAVGEAGKGATVYFTLGDGRK